MIINNDHILLFARSIDGDHIIFRYPKRGSKSKLKFWAANKSKESASFSFEKSYNPRK